MFTKADKLHHMKEYAEIRLTQEIKERELGADNLTDIHYWRGYVDALKRLESDQ